MKLNRDKLSLIIHTNIQEDTDREQKSRKKKKNPSIKLYIKLYIRLSLK